MSDLRDRIAAELRWYYPASDFHHGVVADAVIAELGGEEVLQYLQVPQRIVAGWQPDDLWPVIDRLIEMAGPRCFGKADDE